MRCRRMMFPANIWIKSNERAACPMTTRALQRSANSLKTEKCASHEFFPT